MANYSEQITALHRSLDGVIAVMLLDAETGFTLAQVGGDEQSEVVGAGITQFTSLFNATMEKLNYPHLEENTFTIGDPVSYTHRDVYKRQVECDEVVTPKNPEDPTDPDLTHVTGRTHT